jgi:hypothetical protein
MAVQDTLLILLCMRPHTTVYTRPHTTLYMRPRTITLLQRGDASCSTLYVCPLATLCMRPHTIYVCPHTTICVSLQMCSQKPRPAQLPQQAQEHRRLMAGGVGGGWSRPHRRWFKMLPDADLLWTILPERQVKSVVKSGISSKVCYE